MQRLQITADAVSCGASVHRSASSSIADLLMVSASPIQLVAKREEDLQGAMPDYAVYAGEQLVGRIYQMHQE